MSREFRTEDEWFEDEQLHARRPSPGKSSLTAGLPSPARARQTPAAVQRKASAPRQPAVRRASQDAIVSDAFNAALGFSPQTPLQLRETTSVATTDDPHVVAARGVSGSGGTLPHLETVQRAFGRHDVTGVRAHTSGAAATAAGELGARAYASGDQVAFAETPDLFLVAHEAAHVVQQRGGVQLSGGVGEAGDVYEQHADEVAAAVVRGESAATLLDRHAGGSARTALQRDGDLRERTRRREITVPRDLAALRTEVASWLGREVSRARVDELIDGSNLADVHRRLVANDQVGQPATLSMRLIPEGSRYARVEFGTPGRALLDEIPIEGAPEGQSGEGTETVGPQPAPEPGGRAAPEAEPAAPEGEQSEGAQSQSGSEQGAQSQSEQSEQGEGELRNAVVQQPDQVCEAGEPGDLSGHHLDLIRAFARRAHELIAPWVRQRNTQNLRFDDSAMQAHYRSFTTNWMRDIAAQEGNTDRPVAFENNQAAVAEARRLLDSGTFRQSVREIQAFNHNALGSYSTLLGLGPQDAIEHHYRLEVVGGIQGGAGEGVNVEASARRYDIHYDNEMGMRWTGHGNSFTAGAGPGAGTSPIAANVDLGGTYEGTSRSYFDSEDFDGSTIYYLAGGAQAGEQAVGAEALVFRNNGRQLRVSSTQLGRSDRVGTDNVGNVGVMTGAGAMDVTSVDRPRERLPEMESQPQQPPTQGEWSPLISMAILFRTQEDQLDDEDRATIEDMIRRMRAYEARHPGSVFRIASQGRASRRWRGARSEEEAFQHNTQLARQRCGVVQQAFAQRLVDMQAEFQSGVIEASRSLTAEPGGQSGETPDDNRQLDRSVLVAISYNACAPEGRADGGLRL